jgi:nucleoside-diphosphate-sugar epimerase
MSAAPGRSQASSHRSPQGEATPVSHRLLITGADGFTGRAFCSLAAAAGHTLLPLRADLTDAAAVGAEVAALQPTAVLHLAAISFVAHADTSAFDAVNVQGSRHLLMALAALPQPPHKVLLASSANVYGNCPHSPITEQQAPAPVNAYARSKLAMEQMAQSFTERLPIVLTRPFNYTGPGQAPQFLIPKLVDHFVRRADRVELGNLAVEREFNDVRLVCQAYLGLLDKGVPGDTYNVCSGQAHTLQSVIELLSRLCAHRLTVSVNPAFVRPDEVHRLSGDPAKLRACLGGLPTYSLEDTLLSMIGPHAPPEFPNA